MCRLYRGSVKVAECSLLRRKLLPLLNHMFCLYHVYLSFYSYISQFGVSSTNFGIRVAKQADSVVILILNKNLELFCVWYSFVLVRSGGWVF